MDTSDRERRARSFGAQAAAYDRGRPGYPAAALRYCLPDDATTVLDLGAGTGKLTAGLLELGLAVVAVEPSEAMRALIPSTARVLEGTAEAIPLPDASVDAVLVGQAFHWFDAGPALTEIARVLRPGGIVGLLWNRIRPGTPWSDAVAALLRERSHVVELEAPWSGRGDLSDPEWRWFEHVQETDAEQLADNVASRSAIILETPEERRRAVERVEAVVPAGPLRLSLDCGVWRADRTRPCEESCCPNRRGPSTSLL